MEKLKETTILIIPKGTKVQSNFMSVAFADTKRKNGVEFTFAVKEKGELIDPSKYSELTYIAIPNEK